MRDTQEHRTRYDRGNPLNGHLTVKAALAFTAARIDSVRRIVIGVHVAVKRDRILNIAWEWILAQEPSVRFRVIPSPEIIVAARRVELLSVVQELICCRTG